MKPYGVPRVKDAEYPDLVDIKKFGFSTEDRCSRKDRGKNKARMYWKKKARAEGKKELTKET